MTGHRAAIADAVRTYVVHSGVSYLAAGRLHPDPVPAALRGASRELRRVFLCASLQHHIYSDFYCRSRSMRLRGDGQRGAAAAPELEAALARANCGTGYRSHGWTLLESDGHVAKVRKDELTLYLSSRMVSAPVSEAAASPLVSVPMPKAFMGLSPGYYLAVGDCELPSADAARWARIYLHLSPAGAVQFMALATPVLNECRLAFNLKALNHPASYDRCDTVVLYINRADFHAVAKALAPAVMGVSLELRAGVPALTKELRPGVSVAENPGSAQSYGEHRCALLAEALVRAHELRARSIQARIAVVEERLTAAGIDVDAPYLNPGSTDCYVWPDAIRPLGTRRVPARTDAGTAEAGTERYLCTAESIGRRLIDTAVWHLDRCTWLGVDHAPDPVAQDGFRQIHQTLGATLYSGTSGVALFLAELARSTGGQRCRETALAAIRQSFWQLERTGADRGIGVGLFDGALGVAFAAARIGVLLGENALVARAVETSIDALRAAGPEREPDLICGTAGAIVAALGLARIAARPDLVRHARRLGDELIAAADRRADGYSWPSRAVRNQRHLTGLAHGVAGIGYALAELYAATWQARFRRASEMAFAYERACFDAAKANWPDFRGIEVAARTHRATAPCSAAWCHGAPGIALTRIRAFEIFGEDDYQSEALLALETTRGTLLSEGDLDSGNFSLCHGLCGNAEIVLQGGRLPRWDSIAGLRLVRRLADHGRVRYEKGESWPCGGGRGETPGLMLGIAGIGSFYLHLHDRSIPSMAMLAPLESFPTPTGTQWPQEHEQGVSRA